MSLSSRKDVIDTLQSFIGIVDAPDGAVPLEGMDQSPLLDQILQLGPGEQRLIVEVLAQHARVLGLSRVKERDPLPEISNARTSSEAGRVRMAVRFLEANASGPVSLDKVAEHVGWSKWHCARVFKRHTGFGVAEFSRLVRVDKARLLLADRTLTIKEVAAAAGFTHPSDLTRCFLRAYGVSPSGFRSSRLLGAAPRLIDRKNSQQKARK